MYSNASSNDRRSQRVPLPNAARARALLVLVACVSLGLPANAQDARPEGPFARQGYPLGQIRVFPSLSIENTYNDNIFASKDGKLDDYFVSVLPRVELESSWSRHAVSASAYGQINRYADIKSEDNDEYGVNASGRLDLADHSALGASFGNGRTTNARANSENTDRKDPQQFDYLDGELQYDHSFARFDLGLRGSVRQLNFLDAVDADRDRLVFGVSSRLSYPLSSAFSVFVQPDAKFLDYEQSIGDDGLEQNRSTLGGFVGSSFDVATLNGDVSLGVMHAAFDESSSKDVTILGVRSQLSWEATRLTRVRARVERSILPTGVDGASSKVRTRVSLDVSHELFRNLTLRAAAIYFQEDFKQLGRNDDNFRVLAGAEYQINRFVSITARYSYRERHSSTSDNDFRSNIAMLTINLQL